ncbi:hypothetical protein BH11PLA2_BH11PLA2_28750 [soil metagenome]
MSLKVTTDAKRVIHLEEKIVSLERDARDFARSGEVLRDQKRSESDEYIAALVKKACDLAEFVEQQRLETLLQSDQKIDALEQKVQDLTLIVENIRKRSKVSVQMAHDLVSSVQALRNATRRQSDAEIEALGLQASELELSVESIREITLQRSNTPMMVFGESDQLMRRQNEELERRVQARTAELETSNHELEAFCYSVSHDLRPPLRSMDGFSRVLLEKYADTLDEKGRHYLHRIRTGTQRMGQLIDDLLKLSRMSRSELVRQHVDLSAKAAKVVAQLREREPERNVTFSVQPGMFADCDPRLMRIVLENLFANAWKFTANKSLAVVVFEQVEKAAQPAFVVRDDGVGFDMAYAGKLFGAFQRLHSDRDFPGTGIGLATVQRIIRRHGGEVWAESTVNGGASFYFTLPGTEPIP